MAKSKQCAITIILRASVWHISQVSNAIATQFF
nr:MAG TPA: hypothetical protein [Caudoviricetes sp.]